MDDQSRPRSMSEPKNAVLRGGPFDGEIVSVDDLRAPLAINKGGRSPHIVYRPTSEADDEYPTLVRYVIDHAEGT